MLGQGRINEGREEEASQGRAAGHLGGGGADGSGETIHHDEGG